MLKKSKAAVVAAMSLSVLAACEGRTPEVQGRGAVVPTLSPNTTVMSLDAPSTEDAESGGGDEEHAGQCAEWVTVSESYNQLTGDFEYVYECEEGGAIARIVTAGHDDGAGNGSYTQTYEMRDGSQIVWTYTYTISEDGLSQVYVGTSNEGESYEGTYTFLDQDRTQVQEVWRTTEGDYFIEGVQHQDGTYEGTRAYDDPSTPASPDWTLDETRSADGTFTQSAEQTFEGYTTSWSAAYAEDGSVEYAFETDDLTTQVAPDFQGSYSYAADYSGSGGYRQDFDDGSILLVEQQISADGGYVESWTFDDASTEQALDQEGSITYAADGAGTGTLTTHVVGGDAETCRVTVAADGTTTIDQCG